MVWEGLGGTPGDPGELSEGLGRVGRPTCRSWRGREAHQDVWEGSGGPPEVREGSGGTLGGREAHPKVREGLDGQYESRVPPTGPEGPTRSPGGVTKPTRRSVRCRETHPVIQENYPKVWEG